MKANPRLSIQFQKNGFHPQIVHKTNRGAVAKVE